MHEATRRFWIAPWDKRALAYVIDVTVVWVVLLGLGEVAGAVTGLAGAARDPVFDSVSGGFVLFAYWTILEGHSGQSIGKRYADIVVTDERGDPIRYEAAAIESFGKAFLLPLDLVAGWLLFEGENVRLTNRLTGTVVVMTEDPAITPW